jgi:hypothetical protein
VITGPTLVYSLCLVASIVCAGPLVRAYLRTRAKLPALALSDVVLLG